MMLLNCDKEFCRLKPALDHETRSSLAENIRLYGCREPLIVWGQTLIDGYKRYEICKAFGFRFNIRQITLRSREDAMILICKDLLRKNMNEERKKYLIGKLYDAQRQSNAQSGFFPPPKPGSTRPAISAPIASDMCHEYQIGTTTLGKYKRYARMLDRICIIHSGFGQKLLDGKIQASHERVIEIGELSDSQILTLAKEAEISGTIRITSRDVARLQRQAGNRSFLRPVTETPSRESFISPVTVAQPQSIKEMPKHDPDSAVNSLSLTVPSWRYSINRVRENRDYPFMVSDDAKAKLRSELLELKHLVNICVREMQM